MFTIAVFTNSVNISGLFAFLIFMLGLFSIPLSMAIYLAKQIAFTNKNLEKPLGTVKDFPYKLVETELKKGDVLFLYSDGLPELFNGEKELLGYEKIKEELKKVALDTPKNIIENFKKVIDNWKGNHEINDDITFIVIQKK